MTSYINGQLGRFGEKSGSALVHPFYIDKKFKEYIVLTTFQEIEDAVKRYSILDKTTNMKTLGSCFNKLTKYSEEELNSCYENKNKDWQNWCDDVIIFYAIRSVIFRNENGDISPKFCIPLTPLDENELKKWKSKL